MSRSNKMEQLLCTLKEMGGSDLHMATGIRPCVRLRGRLTPIEGWPVLQERQLMEMLRSICPEQFWTEFTGTHDVDFAHPIPGVARFRANYFRQSYGAGAVFRIIPDTVIPIEKLNLPPAVAKIAEYDKGLVLVTGPTGSGKSTTLASIIDLINATKNRLIITIEDPVEFVHTPKMSTILHREVGVHADSFAGALQAATRQDADVILVGEMRDHETISQAINAAERGALVFGTLHTNNASKTIDRLIDAFPEDEQEQARLMLSQSLSAVVAQLLLRTADGQGRCAVNEILLATPGLPNIIREGKISMLASLIQSGKGVGMQSMDDALFEAAKSGRVAAKEARARARDKARFASLR
ncbi:MAG: type IV pilus twitching motility protein PilT [Bradymonadia bacterium]